MKLKCTICNKKYESKRADGKYCSIKCGLSPKAKLLIKSAKQKRIKRLLADIKKDSL